MAKRINIVVVDPSSIIRCGVVTLLQRATMSNITVAESADIATVISQKRVCAPDLLIINSSCLGYFSPAQLRVDIGNENLKIIALQSTFVEQNILQNYDGVISIFDTIDTIKEKVLELMTDRSPADSKKELSQREKEIIVCVVKGMTNKQIADTLILSSHTVIAHRRNIANKLQIHSPSGLTIYAIVNKLVDLSEIKNTISQNSEE